jgi:hypothetical protein
MTDKPISILNDHFLCAIGAVVVNWQAIELLMEHTILGLYEITADRGLVITSNLSFQNKLTILRILATQGAIKDTAEAKNLSSILERIDKASQKRNSIVHGTWGPGNVDRIAHLLAIRVRGKRLVTIFNKIPLSEVEDVAQHLLGLRFELLALSDRLGLKPDISPKPGG